MNISVISMIGLLFLIFPQVAFSINQDDSLKKARQLFDSGKYQQASKLLKVINKEHPEDLNTQWLYAQSAYWSKKLNLSIRLYENAIDRHSDDHNLLLDYGIKMVDIGEFKKASSVINTYMAYDNPGPDVQVAYAKMAYWQYRYKKAMAGIEKVLSDHPENEKARSLYEELLIAKSPWIRISSEITSDDQPLFSLVPSVEAGFSKNAFLNLSASFKTPRYFSDGLQHQTFDIQLNNEIRIKKINTKLLLGGGVFKLPTNEESFTGKLKLTKSILRWFSIELLAEHKPYLYTKANMTNPVQRLNYDLSLNWTGKKGWMGRIGHNINHFYSDDNKVYSTSLWVVSSPIKTSKTESRLGYAHSYSDSEYDTFSSIKTMDQIIASWQIIGNYNPYFTPKDQSINYIIYQFRYNPSPKFETGLKLNYGFLATTQNPYFFLINDGSNGLSVVKDFYKDVYHPYDGTIYINWNLGKRMSIQSEYILSKTHFYRSHSGMVSLKVSI
jgi:tetratricopeptide (TPR) repeat protein